MSFLSHGSRFMAFMDRLADVFILNLIWLLASLPIVTIGASTTAAFSVAMKLAEEKEEASIWKAFWKAFRLNFRQGSLLWTLQAVALYALSLDIQIISLTPEPSFLLVAASAVSIGFIVPMFLYAYPQAARYENGLWNILKNSYRISFRYIVKTLILVAVLALEWAVFSWNSLFMFFGFLVGPMIAVYTIGGMALKIFADIESASGPGPGTQEGATTGMGAKQ
jgi:uncharacterized membrane protein YesL